MHAYSLITVLAILASGANVVSAVTCGKGTYRVSPGTNGCEYCQPGTYSNSQNNPPNNMCTNLADPGHFACGDKTVNGVQCYGAQGQDNCGQGNYQPTAGMAQCIPCPPGYKCPNAHTEVPVACEPGRYQPTEGAGANGCGQCEKGTYNNGYASTKCCTCCAGTFNNQPGQTHCRDCAENTHNPPRPYSTPGADNVNDCEVNPIPGFVRNNSCKEELPPAPAHQGYCFPEQGTGPTGLYNKKRSLKCAKGLKRCPHFHGKGGFDCVDIKSDPESCGGCVSLDDSIIGTGVDCTSLPNVSVTRCVRGKCIIKSCSRRHTLSDDGKSCEPADHALKSQRRKRNTGSLHNPVSRNRHFDV